TESSMALSALRLRRTMRVARAFATSSSSSSSSTVSRNVSSAVFSSSSSTTSHLFGHSQLAGFGRPCPASRHLLARCRSWTELKDCKHWLITLDFPKDPKPTREEMIDAYVKTLAAVLGSVEEAKKKIYALSTTTYTGFQCNIDETTSERLKEQPLVNWVLPDGYGDPELGIFAGDRYDNGVITPDPNPPKPYNERPRQRNNDRPRYDRQRDFRPMERRDNLQGERRDFGPRENYNRRPMEGRDSMQGGRRDFRPQFEQRDPMQGDQRGYKQPDDRRGPMPPVDRRGLYQGEQRDTAYEGERRDEIQGE
ncbi:hypothetical protein KI387_000013, partial [Taxus chinensis]